MNAAARRGWRAVALTVACVAAMQSGAALAQQSSSQSASWPPRPVRVVVPYTAGGPVDFIIRTLQPRLLEIWGQPVVIENRAGAAAQIGGEYVMRQPADGLTLLLGGVQTHAMVVGTVKKMLYDPIKDFTPVTQTTRANWMLVVHPSIPVNTPAEWMALVRASPGKYTYGSSGIGSVAHLAFESLAAELGLKLLHSPYKGTSQAAADTVAGSINMVMGDQSTLVPLVKAGRLRAIAMTGNPGLPEVPTLAETLVRGFDAQAWQGVWGPAGMNAELVKKINADFARAVRSPDVMERLRASGVEPVGSGVEEFDRFVKREIATWTSAAKKAGIEPE